MSIENVAIARIIDTGEIIPFIDGGITGEFFHSSKPRIAYEWCAKYFIDYGAAPTEEAFKRQFPTFRFEHRADEPMQAVIDELRTNHSMQLMVEGLPPVVAALSENNESRDPAPALAALHRLMETVDVVTAVSDVEEAADFADVFLQQLELLARGGGMQGITTGFPTIDMASGGWLPEQLIILAGAPKRGKSIWLLWSAMAAARAGYRVLLVSFEMSNLEQKQRMFSLGAHVALNNILRATPTDADWDKLEKYKDELEQQKENTGGELFLVHDVSSTTTLSGLTAKVRTYKPDIVFVDGVYMMIDETATKQDNETVKLTRISRGLKRIAATERVPLVCTTQALLSKMTKKEGTTMESFGWTSAWSQDANVIMGIDREDLASPVSRLKIIAARSMVGMELNVSLDLFRGVVSEQGMVSDDETAFGYSGTTDD